jgi:hypothetical protein
MEDMTMGVTIQSGVDQGTAAPQAQLSLQTAMRARATEVGVRRRAAPAAGTRHGPALEP